jgi:PTS system ascorbate-specific IIA component
MSVGILLITHSGIGGALLNVAYGTFGRLPLMISQLSVCRDFDPDILIDKALDLVRDLDTGEGVLVLSDLFGSTPSNIAHGLEKFGSMVRIITGLNLPMLFRILNYPHLNLSQLAKKAVEGGKEGIFERLYDTQKMSNSK